MVNECVASLQKLSQVCNKYIIFGIIFGGVIMLTWRENMIEESNQLHQTGESHKN